MKAMTIGFLVVLTAQLSGAAQESKTNAVLQSKSAEKPNGQGTQRQSVVGPQNEKYEKVNSKELNFGLFMNLRMERVDSDQNVVSVDGVIDKLALGDPDTVIDLATNTLRVVDGYVEIVTKKYGVLKMNPKGTFWLTPSQKAAMMKLVKKDQSPK